MCALEAWSPPTHASDPPGACTRLMGGRPVHAGRQKLTSACASFNLKFMSGCSPHSAVSMAAFSQHRSMQQSMLHAQGAQEGALDMRA